MEEIREGLNTALNEASLISVQVDRDTRRAWVTLSVLMLPEEGPPPADPRVLLRLHPVGRVAASLRGGNWDDPEAAVQSFELEHLAVVVESFEAQPIYGWKFLDDREEESASWLRRLSLDTELGPGGRTHSLFLFQEGIDFDRHLDLLIWFDEMTAQDPRGTPLPLSELVARGVRWWKAFRAHDPRTMQPSEVMRIPLEPG